MNQFLILNLKSAGGLHNEGLKYMTDAGSTEMSTVIVALATVNRAILRIAAYGA